MNETQKNKEDLVWLLKCMCNEAPDIKFIEPTMQSLSLLYATKNNSELEHEDLVKLSLSGFIAMRARMVDENKFTEIHPFLYYQAAQYLMHTSYEMGEDTEQEFLNFIEKIKS